jgi:hypothetical protein
MYGFVGIRRENIQVSDKFEGQGGNRLFSRQATGIFERTGFGT